MQEPTYLNPYSDIEKLRNRLPHWEQDNCTYFITQRLHDSLPMSLLAEWKAEKTAWEQRNAQPWNPSQEKAYHQLFSHRKEQLLDRGLGGCMLRQSKTRKVVQQVWFSGSPNAHIWCGVIMPNHIHLLASLLSGVSLSNVMKSWKGKSARLTNQARGATGTFWAKDYYDRLIRDGRHFRSCASYIRANPLKAKLKQDDYSMVESEYVKRLLDDRAN
jgi:putative transposase